MEFLEGISLAETAKIKKKFLNKRAIIKNYMDSMFKQIFVDGLFHGDPHPANIIVQRNRKIGFVDFGIVGELSPETRIEFLYGVNALLDRDGMGVIDAILRIGEVGEESNVEEFKKNALTTFNKLFRSSLGKSPQARVLLELINVASEYEIKYPIGVVLYIKALITMEGTIKRIDPRIKFTKEMYTRVKEAMEKKINFNDFFKEGRKFFYDFASFMRRFPKRADKIMNKLENEKLGVEIEKREIKEIEKEIEKTSNTKAIAVIVAALLISSVLTLQMETQPVVLGINLSVILFILSVVFIIYLVISLASKK
jgi:ubiquinone biosynthesis protein